MRYGIVEGKLALKLPAFVTCNWAVQSNLLQSFKAEKCDAHGLLHIKLVTRLRHEQLAMPLLAVALQWNDPNAAN